MSLISRSRRCTSSRMMLISFFCCIGSSMRAAVSTALLSDVSGFLISCDTSAAKRSIASMRRHNASVMSLSAPDRSPISSRRRGKSGMTVCRP